MVLHVLDALAELPIDRVVVVVGYRSADVIKAVQAEAPPELRIEFVEQIEPLGTGDAAAVALTGFETGADLAEGDLVVLPGDTPLLRPATLAASCERTGERRRGDAAYRRCSTRLVTGESFGPSTATSPASSRRRTRPTRNARSTEVATSIYCFRHSVLAPTLRRLARRRQGEYYLTDAIGVLAGRDTRS